MKTKQSIPAAAEWAATELARLPVLAQAMALEAELAGTGDGDADDAVLEGPGGVHGVVLDPEGVEADGFGQAVGLDQRGEAGADVDLVFDVAGEEVGVAPERGGTRPPMVSRVVLAAMAS